MQNLYYYFVVVVFVKNEDSQISFFSSYYLLYIRRAERYKIKWGVPNENFMKIDLKWNEIRIEMQPRAVVSLESFQ